MSITLNGQLLLSMLCEQLMDIPNSKLLMINTDGGEIIIPSNEINKFYDICKSWEKLTKLQLEYNTYSKILISNCNSYIAIYEDGKVKQKGPYTIERELYKDHSRLIVPKAVEAYYLHNIPIEDFIKNHNDIFDFFLRTKLNKDSNLIGINGDDIIQLPKLTRYLVTNTGYTLLKIMNERQFNIQKDYLCTPCNYLNDEIKSELFKNINYDFYIDKANKLLIGEDNDED